MAAVDPSVSPKQQNSPAEELETSGGKTDVLESGCSLTQTGETIPIKTQMSPDNERAPNVVRDGGCIASHSEVSAESGAGADKTTFKSPDQAVSTEKMTETPGSDKREYEWSETEDDDKEAKTQTKENSKCDISDVTSSAKEVPQVTSVDTNIAAVDAKDFSEEDPSFSTSRSNEKRAEGEQLAEEPVGDVDGTQNTLVDQEEGVERGEAADPSAKIKKCRLVCKECGKRFARREMFNLHRHFHAHEDELTPLTCKECGLTFQHRSSLIKHRNEHKEKEELLVTPKKERETMGKGRFQCAECKSIFSMADDLRDHNCCNTVEKPFHCPLCRQEFQFKVSITKHMMSHSIENTHSCQECSQTFPHATALRLHQRSHSALKPYECPECGLVFKHYSFMEDHRRKHTKNTRSHLCNICGKSFKYSSLLHQHQYLHTGQKPFRCLECGKQFAFAQNMKAHCRQHRLRQTKSAAVQPSKQAPVSIPETVRGPGKENTYQIEEPKRTFSCPLCPQTYQVPASLRAHMLIHEAEYEKLERTPRPPSENDKFWEKGHNCPHCPCIYRDEYSLNLHIKSVHKSAAQPLENVSAPPSNKQFIPLSRESAQGKCRSDGTSSIKSYKCSECGKTFRHRSVLELHMRIHSKGKPYQCNECGKTFRFSSYLQQHLIIHTGKKPYKCSDCGKEFAFLQNMRSHQKLHQEKPFRCTSCRKGYSDETQLQHHMLTHNGDKPHKCHLCDKTFGLAYLLRDHMNTHTGERPHRCEECHKTFSWFSSLLVHQKIHARRRSSYSQYTYSPIGARMRGRGNRGRRGGRLTGGWSRSLGSSGMVSSQPSPYIGSALRDAELQRRAVQTQSAMLSSHVDLQGTQKKEPWLPELQPQPVQWKVDGGEVKPVPSSQQPHAAPQQHHQKSPVWADSLAKTQSGPTAHSSESAHMRDSAASSVSSLLPAVPKKSSPSAAVSEMEQHRQPKPVTWSSTLTSTTLASSSSLQLDFSVPSFVDGALWSIRPPLLANSQSRPSQELQPPRWSVAPMSMQKEPSTLLKKEDSRVWDMNNPQVIPSTVSQPENPWNSCDLQNQWASGLAGASTSAQLDQSSAMSISTPVSHGVGSTLWDLQTPPGIPKTITSPETLINSQEFQLQQKQVSSGWTNVQSPASQQNVPISIQYEPHCFGQGMGAPVWGFQSHPVGPQTLLPGQLKPGNGQELQQQPMVTGTQIIINPPSPFFSSPLAPLPPLALPGPPHPLHSVAVGALSRSPHPNLFFTPQAVMSERSHIPQTLALPQLVHRTEPHKLGARLPFAPERLLQCMICGCSLPRELDLQMHYLQHAQGEI